MPLIPKFYQHRSVLITGATGFLGKVLLVKLLKSCPEIGGIYTLIRPKRGDEASTRLQQLLSSKAFDIIKHQHPESLSKVHGVQGDITTCGLGLTSEIEKALIENVSVVFHCGATVKFNEDLRIAINTNVAGTNNLLKLCEKMHALEAVVHVSTTFCHCQNEILEEVITPMCPSSTEILDAIRWMDPETIQHITPKLLEGPSNAYTYTKALGEDLIHRTFNHLPISIFRPSIIESSWKEPFPGWLDSTAGAVKINAVIMKGIPLCLQCDSSVIFNTVPVDMCVNEMIAISWYLVAARSSASGIPVFNLASGELNGQSVGRYLTNSVASARKIKLDNRLYYPPVLRIKWKFCNDVVSIFVTWLPATLLKGISIVTGRKFGTIKVLQDINRGMKYITPFLTNSFQFKTANSVRLWDSMSEEDQKVFNFDIRLLNWKQYRDDMSLGIRTHLFKEEISTLPNAPKRHCN